MKANEFVEKFGLDSFKAAMLCPQFKRYNYAILYSDEVDFSNELIEKHLDYMFNTSEIERLVESHELVEECGGITKAKERVAQEERLPNPNIFHVLVVYNAIADVESCQ